MFCWLNGYQLVVPASDLYELAMGLSNNQATKADAAVLIARHMKLRP